MSSTTSTAFDLSRYPLVIHRLASAYESAEWDRMLFDLTAIIKRGPFGLITDTRQGQMPNARQRRAFIDMYERHDLLTRANFLVLGAVGDSTVLNGVITALNWLRPPPHPVKVFATFREAETWVLAQLPEPLRSRVPAAKRTSAS